MSADDVHDRRLETTWPPDPHRPTPPPGRDGAAAFAVLNFLAGVWLVISPWVAGYRDTDPWWNAIFCGITIASFALARAAVPSGTRFLSYFNAAVGGWVFASAFVLPGSAVAAWNAGVLGVVVVGLAGLALSARGRRDAGL